MLAGSVAIGLIATLILIIFMVKDGFDIEVVGFGFLGLLLTALLATFCTLPVYGIAMDDTRFSQNLQALNDSTSTHGSFFLGSGTVDSYPAYYYYERRDDGSFYQWQVYAANASIVETSGTPHVERVCQDNYSFGHWIIWPLPMSEYDHTCSPDDEAIFYVPQGSVTNTFNLDLEN
jgi:hypothetical protein